MIKAMKARTLGITRESGQVAYKMLCEDGTYRRVQMKGILPSRSPFVEYEFDDDGRVVSVRPLKATKKELFDAVMYYYTQEKALSLKKEIEAIEFEQTAIKNCKRWELRSLLEDVAMEDVFYKLLARFPSKFLHELTKSEREELAKLDDEVFEFWPLLVDAVSFGLKPPNVLKKPVRYAEGAELRTCWMNKGLCKKREMLDAYYKSFFLRGLPQLSGEFEALDGLLVPFAGFMTSPSRLELERKFFAHCKSAKEVCLISCSARDENFVRKLRRLFMKEETEMDVYAPNKTWMRELTRLTGMPVRLLKDAPSFVEVLMIDLAHKMRLDDVVHIAFSKLILVGDLYDCATSYWLGGGQIFHDLWRNFDCIKIVWKMKDWKFYSQHNGLRCQALYSYPSDVILHDVRAYNAHLKMLQNVRQMDIWRYAFFCSKEGDRIPVKIGRINRVRVLRTAEVDNVAKVFVGETLRKTTSLEGATKLYLHEGSVIDCRSEPFEEITVSLASEYVGPLVDYGHFYVGKSTTFEEIMGMMKYCKEKFMMFLLPGVNLSDLKKKMKCKTTFSAICCER